MGFPTSHRDGKEDPLARFLGSKFSSSEDMVSSSCKQGGLASEACKALDLADTKGNRKWIANLLQRNIFFKEKVLAAMQVEKGRSVLESSKDAGNALSPSMKTRDCLASVSKDDTRSAVPRPAAQTEDIIQSDFDENTVLCSFGEFREVTGSDFFSLYPQKHVTPTQMWLTSSILDACAESILSDVKDRVVYVPSDESTMFLDYGGVGGECNITKLKLSDKSVVFFPYQNKSHWYLLVANFCDSLLTVMDPYGGRAEVDVSAHLLSKFINGIKSRNLHSEDYIDIASWKLAQQKHCIQVSSDVINCGVFILHFMERVALQKTGPCDFDPKSHRQYLANKVLAFVRSTQKSCDFEETSALPKESLTDSNEFPERSVLSTVESSHDQDPGFIKTESSVSPFGASPDFAVSTSPTHENSLDIFSACDSFLRSQEQDKELNSVPELPNNSPVCSPVASPAVLSLSPSCESLTDVGSGADNAQLSTLNELDSSASRKPTGHLTLETPTFSDESNNEPPKDLSEKPRRKLQTPFPTLECIFTIDHSH